MLTVLHASDFQCGRPFRADAAEAFLRFAAKTAPDVVVVSGDLTQRAKVREFAVAKGILARLPRVPVVLTPGNHDVPLYRIFERAFSPYKNWRAAISPELDTVVQVDGATFVALNSSAPHRAIVSGRIDDDQLDFARRAFDTAPTDDIRCLVIHHHFVPPPDGSGGRTLPRAGLLASRFESMGVDMVLGGHVHQTHFTTSRDLLGEKGGPLIPFIACGTTTSWRGRGPEADRNSLNVVRVRPGDIEIVPHRMDAGGDTFAPGDPVVYSRPTSPGKAAR